MPDLYDISHHNTIIDWAQVELIPIVHKVNEGTKIDTQIRARMPTISARTELFGGYTVLIVSASSIRKQIETYVAVIEPWWRDGAFTQLDVEPWDAYDRPVNCDEIEEAQAVHDELLGPGRLTVYINPNQLPGTFQEWIDRNAGRPLWLPNYSADGANQAHRWGAAIHQYTSSHPAPGFTAGIDANRVLDWEAVNAAANLTATMPPPEPDPPSATTITAAIDANATLWIGNGITRFEAPSMNVVNNYIVLGIAGCYRFVNANGDTIRHADDIFEVEADTIAALGRPL